MVLPHNLCSHIQNAFRTRHQRIAVHHNTQNLAILSILLRNGFLSNVTRGTIKAPSPDDFLLAGDAEKRIWAELKYREDQPVLTGIELVSKPNKPVFMDSNDIRRLCTGRHVQNVKPLRMGEIAIVKTQSREHQWVEAREALELRLPRGEVICRAW
ncbi:ribosomal protein S8 [Epithele typhae]|uniref:ribosomal protein S8 n=1 Tax=Epithele typhae TaxID=378194 RepID=UPI0020088CAC|nr:ribosomal protein S8 [Epithele typhae]XP_047881013.1 ribosomal protein S8 [Epithele typhae]KAH9899126.1 ribosomal protein S8 [Epithele typhae]KAH9941293.1 ribosomal protein S8 [Epithele typhae]